MRVPLHEKKVHVGHHGAEQLRLNKKLARRQAKLQSTRISFLTGSRVERWCLYSVRHAFPKKRHTGSTEQDYAFKALSNFLREELKRNSVVCLPSRLVFVVQRRGHKTQSDRRIRIRKQRSLVAHMPSEISL